MFSHVRQYIIAGILTVIPIWVTWAVFSLLLGMLSQWGDPVANALAKNVGDFSPAVGAWLQDPWFTSAIAVRNPALWPLIPSRFGRNSADNYSAYSRYHFSHLRIAKMFVNC